MDDIAGVWGHQGLEKTGKEAGALFTPGKWAVIPWPGIPGGSPVSIPPGKQAWIG